VKPAVFRGPAPDITGPDVTGLDVTGLDVSASAEEVVRAGAALSETGGGVSATPSAAAGGSEASSAKRAVKAAPPPNAVSDPIDAELTPAWPVELRSVAELVAIPNMRTRY
jgi:hypothetical protein